MADELAIKGKQVVSLVIEKGIPDVIRPLQREIYLFDTYIAGTTHLKDKSVIEAAAEGDRLILQREEKNKYDEHAILILNEKGKKMGYVPEKDNIVFSRLMDAGKLLTAKIKTITQKGSFTQIQIEIYLVDF